MFLPTAHYLNNVIEQGRRFIEKRTRRQCSNRIESDDGHVKRNLRAMHGPPTTSTAWTAIQGFEAGEHYRKRHVIGIIRHNTPIPPHMQHKRRA
jgi:transposase-like protein